MKLLAGIDFTNLEEKQKEIDDRYQSFRDFNSFLVGVLIGVVVTIPVQLLLKPFAVRDSQLTYGSAVLVESLSLQWYVFSVLFLFSILLVGILIAYAYYQGITNWETVRLQTRTNHDKLYQESKEILNGISNERNLNFKAVDNQIVIKDPSATNTRLLGRMKPSRGRVLELQFDTDVTVLHLGFAPENRHTPALLSHFEESIEEMYDADS
ncbi:hypothetical protein [Haloarchaeobius baliensis]|uniref:hypothetical protein n=1 Tax=Haloarchaeobius baliensis TaxID=1670458 RepID=UPI003F8829A9